MPTTLITRPGQTATSVSVTPYNLTGWALSAEFSSLPTFTSITTKGVVTYDLTKGYITLTLTGAEVDSIGSCYYRVRAIKSGSTTHFAAAGRIELQNGVRTAVTPDILINGYLPEAYVGLISTIDYPVATTLVAGGVRLGGDLGGTSAAPTVPALALKYVKPSSGIPETDLTSSVQSKLNYSQVQSVNGLQGAVVLDAGLVGAATAEQVQSAFSGSYQLAILGLPPGSTLTVTKQGSVWPPRPTDRSDIIVAWKGSEPSPAIVSSGVGGMRDNVDYRLVTA